MLSYPNKLAPPKQSVRGSDMARLGFGRGQLKDPRLPPGQYDTGSSFPVLTAEVSPR